MSDHNNDQTRDSGAIPVRTVLQNIPDPTLWTTPPPATIAGGGNWNSGPIGASGFSRMAVNAKLTQAGTLSVQRYMDVLGLIPIGAAVTQALSANTNGYVVINDGIPYATFAITVTNSSGSTGTLSNVAVLEQS
jgi:hypothetical protein